MVQPSSMSCIRNIRVKTAKKMYRHLRSIILRRTLNNFLVCVKHMFDDLHGYDMCEFHIRSIQQIIDLFRGACAIKGNVQVAGHIKRVDHRAVFYA